MQILGIYEQRNGAPGDFRRLHQSRKKNPSSFAGHTSVSTAQGMVYETFLFGIYYAIKSFAEMDKVGVMI